MFKEYLVVIGKDKTDQWVNYKITKLVKVFYLNLFHFHAKDHTRNLLD